MTADRAGAGRLPGKVAIITGATSGIGLVTARRFAAEGASLVVCGRDQAAAAKLVSELSGVSDPDGRGRAAAVTGDVSDPGTAARAVAAALKFGPLDILVNNAGMDFTSDIYETTVQDVRRVMEVNFTGAFLMLQAAARAMRGRGGSIVNVTSRTATIGVPTMAVYGASKGALASLTRGAAIDVARDGIRVNAVAPGFTETPLLRDWLDAQPDPSAVRARTAAQIPQGRFGTPDDVAAAILYLASDESAHVTGATLAVDGGYTAG
jgi:NAD(P)-dependent dehydrogenase (short-subunit alcohol dehydrogenase family)